MELLQTRILIFGSNIRTICEDSLKRAGFCELFFVKDVYEAQAFVESAEPVHIIVFKWTGKLKVTRSWIESIRMQWPQQTVRFVALVSLADVGKLQKQALSIGINWVMANGVQTRTMWLEDVPRILRTETDPLKLPGAQLELEFG